MATIGAGDSVALELRDNDGPNALPGTPRALIDVPGASVTTGVWSEFVLPAPVAVDSDGFYLVWYQRGTSAIGTVTSEPVSRRGLKLVGGAFSAYGANATRDLMLRVKASSSDVVFANGFN